MKGGNVHQKFINLILNGFVSKPYAVAIRSKVRLLHSASINLPIGATGPSISADLWFTYVRLQGFFYECHPARTVMAVGYCGSHVKSLRSQERTLDLETRTTAVKYDDTGNGCEKNNLTLRSLLATPIWACEKIDKMFGSGGEAIIHYMWFEQGFRLFGQMMQDSPEKPKEELLKELVEIQSRLGWGTVKATIVRYTPSTVELVVKNPLVKTLRGSQKHIIGSFWTGIFSRYFNKQLTCKDFNYDAEKNEFSCLITSSSQQK